MSIIFADSLENVEVIPTGLFIDVLSGIGGIPRGVITEIFGDEGIGKSSLCLQLVANAQKKGLRCLWIDVEYSYTPLYATSLGVDNSKVGLIRSDYAETALDEAESEIASGKWDVVILDSVGGILPRSEAEKSAEGKTIGGQATIMAKFCRKIVPLLSIHKVALVAINHSFIDIMSGKLLTSGGKKLAYHKSLSIRLKTKSGVSLKSGDHYVGKVVIGEVKKNKLAATERMEKEGQLIFGQGFSVGADLLQNCLERGVITKSGNTLMFGEKKLGVGLQRVRGAVESDPLLMKELQEALEKKI